VAITFNVSISDPLAAATSYHSAIMSTALAAAQKWAQYLSGTASIQIEVRIGQLATNRADGGSATSVYVGEEGGISIYEQGAAGEIRTGVDPNGASPDIIINVDPDYIRDVLWFDPTPNDSGADIPSNRTDAVSVFVHEIGHGLGFNGWRHWTTGVLPGNYMSTYDADVVMVNGRPYFTGATAQGLYGGPVPLTYGNLTHYGNATGAGSDLLGGLMNGVVFYNGNRYDISFLDLAILQDSEVRLSVLVGTNASETLALAHQVSAYGFLGNDVIIGNALNNVLDGGDGNDTLRGGAGSDRMIGGIGSDTYYVDSAGDRVVELAGQGTDRVFSTITLTLAANVENLTLLGAAAINGTGNGLANIITGNGAANSLNGGIGGDRLVGNGGNDTYYVDNAGDVVVEAVGAGIDRVSSTISYTLGANVENLILAGSRAINGTGNGLNNVITGNGAANVLSGGNGNDTLRGLAGNDKLDPGAGNDTLNGGIGLDAFIFKTALNALTNVDRIEDFVAADDTIHLENAVFSKLVAGALPTTQFRVGSAAVDGNDYIIYNKSTGALLYDADGNGSGASVQFATLTGTPTITSADFLVV
jgi:Ca2+-binding RTX toxin-like protein